MNDTKHWVLWRHILDPNGVKIISVHHSQLDAETCRGAAAELETLRANDGRRKRFELGEQVGSRITVTDFAYLYQVTEVGQ